MAFDGVIFDVDGVLVDSPHERAWRDTLDELMNGEWRDILPKTSYAAERFGTGLYQDRVAGKPREAGARAVLDYFGVPDADQRATLYGQRKQQKIVQLIDAGQFVAFPDALRFLLALKALGVPIAAASSSKNANQLLSRIDVEAFARAQRQGRPSLAPGATLLDQFEVNVCGRDFARGKPHPEIFLTAAAELGARRERCIVVEDAPSGVQAAKAGSMIALGVARLGDEELLLRAGADLVVRSLDHVGIAALARGRLELRRSAA